MVLWDFGIRRDLLTNACLSSKGTGGVFEAGGLGRSSQERQAPETFLHRWVPERFRSVDANTGEIRTGRGAEARAFVEVFVAEVFVAEAQTS